MDDKRKVLEKEALDNAYKDSVADLFKELLDWLATEPHRAFQHYHEGLTIRRQARDHALAALET